MIYKKRIEKLRGILDKQELDGAFFISHPLADPHLLYFSGLELARGNLLIPYDKEPVIQASRLELKEADKSWISDVREFKSAKDLQKLLDELKLEKIGICGKFLSWRMKQKLSIDLKDITKELYKLRMYKDKQELELLRKAVKITKAALNEAKEMVKPGMSEQKLEAILEYELKKRGSQRPAFPSIVASGPRTAYPHPFSARRKIKRNELVILDCGAQIKGYKSDLTRMTLTGKSKQIQKLMKIAKEAQNQAISAIKPGVTNFEIDRVARSFIKKHGFTYPHGTGHGIGLEVHELPVIATKGYKKAKKMKISERMVFTIEPAIYTKNFGVRQEDIIIVTKKGAKIL